MYQQGGTVAETLDRIASQDYVLPAIQREFVWKPDQICALFDSLMQGYPFGDFLFWKIDAANSGEYRYYGFVRDYHEKNNPHCPDLGLLPDKPLTAVLDGQQRLTAFNIGLRGSMAIKLPRLRRSNPAAFPRRVLALDLLAPAERDDEGNCYRFEFVEERKVGQTGNAVWFRVPAILSMDGGAEINEYLADLNLEKRQRNHAFRTLDCLHRVVRTQPTVAYYEETKQDIEHVLSIFVRRNSGGTALAYSDLLLSIAVSQWGDLDARKEVHSLVDELNSMGSELGLSKDFVLKAGLMLSDIASVGFQVRNFTHPNMAKLEQNWAKIRDALIRTVQLITDFGFDSKSIRAHSALLPIAYYLYRLDAPTGFCSHREYDNDRKSIKRWLTCSILKASGIWGSGLDTLLTELRDVLRENVDHHFPEARLRTVMRQRGKSLAYSDAEVEDLADMEFADQRMFALLSLTFPFVDVRTHHFHIDHVFPRSLLTPMKLRNAGLGEDQVTAICERANRVANLQLLEGAVNNEKRAKLPRDWLSEHYPKKKKRKHHVELYLLGDVPDGLSSFLDFYERRRKTLVKHIGRLVSEK